jgi:hypothetical protein
VVHRKYSREHERDYERRMKTREIRNRRGVSSETVRLKESRTHYKREEHVHKSTDQLGTVIGRFTSEAQQGRNCNTRMKKELSKNVYHERITEIGDRNTYDDV